MHVHNNNVLNIIEPGNSTMVGGLVSSASPRITLLQAHEGYVGFVPWCVFTTPAIVDDHHWAPGVAPKQNAHAPMIGCRAKFLSFASSGVRLDEGEPPSLYITFFYITKAAVLHNLTAAFDSSSSHKLAAYMHCLLSEAKL